ncbi:hypothetical protein [Paenibacillus polymyxa]|uniref:hypothetical protein n=1 Tax=Paenibacillus polymyxa TaxID=1406 RepID=UPI002379B946|nr:hypothetical protein [Paenibacillus polymyxa]WDM21215.1 hypothetical protein J4I02_19935 [Paenibacillus polymyxa]
MLNKKMKVSGVSCLLFLTVTSSAYADVSATSSAHANASVTSSTYADAFAHENSLINTSGTSKSYNWGDSSAAIYCNGRITVHTFPSGEYSDVLTVELYQPGDPRSWDSYTLQDGGKYNNNVSFKGLYGYFRVRVIPNDDSAKGTFYVEY